ncbi:fimbrial adhesin protein precursor [Xenorhabdus vietnamensis]|uniref:Fimbrial adhesin protein n=1 Tax=Xenorhabdus vietnamensis TaxID=351656 RepID=A0A1Y2SEV0_9GAMM|nr:fimbrial protein [Xenorhabdus vietnamensis]OTA17305.1 fimbrial adhesin protein precursor [Xenorhabdus vietnamensis]
MFIVHKKYRLLLAVSNVLIGLFASICACAESCHFESKYIAQNFSINSGSFPVSREMNIGGIIDSYPVKSVGLNKTHCDASTKIEWKFSGYPLITANGSQDLYDSGVSGIGIRVNTQEHEAKIEFVKTENQTGSGMIKSGTLTAYMEGTAIYSYHLSNISFITPSCFLQKRDILVPMGKIESAEFSGINSTAGEREFTVELSCNTSTPLELVFGTSTLSGFGDVLDLDQDKNSASGVGLQVLYQNQPIPFNSSIKLGNTTDGTHSVSLKARYIQTGNRITAGKANATTTLDIIYP